MTEANYGALLGLTPLQLAICEGRSGLSPAKEAAYRARWMARQNTPPITILAPVSNSNPRRDGHQKPKGLRDCVHLRADTGKRTVCPTCSGRVELKVFSCEVHSICTRGREVAGVHCCTTCSDYEAKI